MPIIRQNNYLYLLLVLFCFLFKQQNCYAQTDKLINDEQFNLLEQTAQGKWHAALTYGMGFGFRNQRLSFTNSHVLIEIGISPTLGYYLYDGLILGVHFDQNLSYVSENYAKNFRQHIAYAGPVIKGFFYKNLFGEFRYGYGLGNETLTISNEPNDFNFNSNRYVFGFGIGNFWLKKASLEVVFKYSYTTNKGSQLTADHDVQSFNVHAGISFGMGKSRKEKEMLKILD